MKIRNQVFLLSALSTIALTTLSEAHFGNSSDMLHVMCLRKARLHEAQVLPVFPRETLIKPKQKISIGESFSESSKSDNLFVGSRKDKLESPTTSSHGLNHKNSQIAQESEPSINNGASYNGPLNVQERQIEHILKCVKALPAKDISSVYHVINRPDSKNHAVFANQNLDHLYRVGMPALVREMKKETGHPLWKRKPLPAKMRPDLGLQNSLSSSNGLRALDANRTPNVLNMAQVIRVMKSPAQETLSLPERDEEPGFMTKQKNRIVSAVKTITSWVKF
ncbi:MAG TPA: hypothetical protein VMW10_12505 [Alphaproteobacteria bacterium]|nr:hypothetical protein [Alphaproteobacteria bacterium]